MGQVCAKHNEYYEERCPWCEEPETDGLRAVFGNREWVTTGSFYATAPDGWLEAVKRAYKITTVGIEPLLDRHGGLE